MFSRFVEQNLNLQGFLQYFRDIFLSQRWIVSFQSGILQISTSADPQIIIFVVLRQAGNIISSVKLWDFNLTAINSYFTRNYLSLFSHTDLLFKNFYLLEFSGLRLLKVGFIFFYKRKMMTLGFALNNSTIWYFTTTYYTLGNNFVTFHYRDKSKFRKAIVFPLNNVFLLVPGMGSLTWSLTWSLLSFLFFNHLSIFRRFR